MSLINCPDCGKQVSNVAAACPNCGYPVAEKVRSGEVVAEGTKPTDPNEILVEVRPSWLGYFWHLVFFWLIVPPIIAWWQRGSVVLRVYHGRITLDRGRMSKCYREFMIQDVRTIDIDQGFWSRLVGIGNLTIATAAATDSAESINGIPDPHRIRELILAERQRR